MKLVFLPISIVGGLAAGQISKKVFDLMWGKLDGKEAPHPKYRETDMRKLALALLIEGALFRLTKGMVDHGTRRGFERATGSWPGDTQPEAA
jgi:Protein of unknown function (DUF4235)